MSQNKCIFITGSCSAHIGNWEQQLGNAAILIGFLNSIHKNLPGVIVTTKYQLSKEFSHAHSIQSLNVEPTEGHKIYRFLITFYNLVLSAIWKLLSVVLHKDFKILQSTPLLQAYYNADIIVDLSGDTYGDNIPFRNFVKHSLEIRIARLLEKPVVSLANSPGPFSGQIKKFIARATLNSITLITTREPLSAKLLQSIGVKTPIITTACPAFLLEPAENSVVSKILRDENIQEGYKPTVGFTLCGYNLYSNPTWGTPESLEDLNLYVPAIIFLLEKLHAQVVLIPHVYRMDPLTAKIIQGPDYYISSALIHMVLKKKKYDNLKIVKGTYSSSEVKGLIGKLDLHISGRLHAGVAALSQYVPTVLLSYGQKHLGFAKLLGQEEYVWLPSMGSEGLVKIVTQAWKNRDIIRAELRERVPKVKNLANFNVRIIGDILDLSDKSKAHIPSELSEKWKLDIEIIKSAKL